MTDKKKENLITVTLDKIEGKFTFNLDKLKADRNADKRGYAVNAFVTQSGDIACIPNANNEPLEITMLISDKSKKSKGDSKATKSML